MTGPRYSSQHVADLLPTYLNGTLDAATAAQVAEHIAGCADCHAQLPLWEAASAAVHVALADVPLPSLTLLDGVWARIDAPPVASTPHQSAGAGVRWRQLWRVTRWQARLLHPAIWLVSPLAFIGATLYCALVLEKTQAAYGLGFILPCIAALGMAFVCEPRIAPDMEITLATPTSPRLVVLLRCALIAGYDLILGMGATLALAHVTGAGIGTLVALWLGPLALLSAISVFFAALIGPPVAVAMTAMIWVARLVRFGTTVGLTPAHDTLWQTNPLVLACAVVLFILAIAVAPQRHAWRDEGSPDLV